MRYVRKLFLATLAFILTVIYLYLSPLSRDKITIVQPTTHPPLFNTSLFNPGHPTESNHTLTIVTGHLPNEDISWLSTNLPPETYPHISLWIHPITNHSSVPNKGHESIIYLSYILQHYNNLPDVVLFIHPHRKAWHNNILHDTDSLTTISRLQLPYVMRQGYFNTRCHLDPGCTSWLKIDRPWYARDYKRKPEEPYLTSSVFHDLHGTDTPVPEFMSQPCCAQLAVSGARIRERSKEFYQHYYGWIVNTTLDDSTSGRLMEYSWQYIFTGLWEWCPSMQDCYCGGYGVCFEGGMEGLFGWLRALKVREKADFRLAVLREKGRTEGPAWDRAVQEVVEKGNALARWKEEAVRRGQNRDVRVKEGRGV
jgi:hypothetical protein